MNTSKPSLINRHDTFLGVCEGLGQDLGFHPNYLRALFAVSMLFNATAVIGVYLALGVLVHAARWVFPAYKAKQIVDARADTAAANDENAVTLAKAA